MSEMPIYPLRFDPIFEYRLWGGRALADWTRQPLPGTGPIGEAWLLSDRDDKPSRVAEGPLKGQSLEELIHASPAYVLGKHAGRFRRFPLLLKFLDVSQMLSVQVHPSDHFPDLLPPGETGKTEGWLVLAAEPASRIYAGLKPGVAPAQLRALSQATVDDCLPSFMPLPGQSILINAGDIHTLGNGLVVLEVQQNSDVTFRLYDWDHVDPVLHGPRPLQIEQALACIDMAQGVIVPAAPVIEAPVIEVIAPIRQELLLDCAYFQVRRYSGPVPFAIGAVDAPTVLVCVGGAGTVVYGGENFIMKSGDLILLPASVGACHFAPQGFAQLVEISIPDA